MTTQTAESLALKLRSFNGDTAPLFESANLLTSQAAEIERLRSALREMEKAIRWIDHPIVNKTWDIARAALGTKEST